MNGRTSFILNTACLDPVVAQHRSEWRWQLYADRAEAIEEETLPLVKSQFSEVIVVGCYKPGSGYRYLDLPQKYYDRRDALLQREAGARLSTGDWLVFCHDDHRPANDFGRVLRRYDGDADLIVPRRIHGETGEELVNGRETNDIYMGGHCLVMRRSLWAKVPWTSVCTTWWDREMTRIWTEAGAQIEFNDELVHVDLEARGG